MAAWLSLLPVWNALASYFARPGARTAAWRALRTRLDTFVKRVPDHRGEMFALAATLCDRTSRDEVATAFKPHLSAIPNGRAQLDHALAAIDACIARRTKIGNLAAALARN